ncbi:hypothetical protein Lal_00042903 [Lupinus albus]|nr:hypothetical protein Lal_00042903 [Lupinus albus]
MAYFSITPSLISSLLHLLSASKVVDVTVICAQARYPKLCSSVLNSKSGEAKGAYLVSLAQYIINVARVNSTNKVIPKKTPIGFIVKKKTHTLVSHSECSELLNKPVALQLGTITHKGNINGYHLSCNILIQSIHQTRNCLKIRKEQRFLAGATPKERPKKTPIGFIVKKKTHTLVSHSECSEKFQQVKLINVLITKSGNDPKAKAHYKTCLTHFNKDEGALSDIDYVQGLLKKGDYIGVGTAASAVITDVDDCLTGGDPKDPPYPDKSNLPQYVDVVHKVVDIILIISKYLTQK